MKKIEDEANSYAINVIMGNKNLSSDYDTLMSTIDSKTYDWSNVKKMIKEVASKVGIK